MAELIPDHGDWGAAINQFRRDRVPEAAWTRQGKQGVRREEGRHEGVKVRSQLSELAQLNGRKILKQKSRPQSMTVDFSWGCSKRAREKYFGQRVSGRDRQANLEKLTRAQKIVYAMLEEGLTNKEIASPLAIGDPYEDQARAIEEGAKGITVGS
jgi:hypothetical protein